MLVITNRQKEILKFIVEEYVKEYPIEEKNGLKKAIKRFLDIDFPIFFAKFLLNIIYSAKNLTRI